ncbi:MAG TPA: alpha-glucan family phosphorylase, partial [Acidimicrobiales bacterium]|nr:alpha-glucan family phosphorylase [Acidimicrobiales bacterium]
ALARAGGDAQLLARADAVSHRVLQPPARQAALPAGISAERPAVFVCAEYGIHESLPLYSGGLGVLAGDIVKTASDRGLPMVAVGLLYRYGYLHQRLDMGGWQHEYWTYIDPLRRPLVRLTAGGHPLTVRVPVWGRDVSLYVWRADIGTVPLYLLDSDHPDNDAVAKWITARLYDGSRDVRLAQYVVLGRGTVRMLEALGIEPGVVHLNEGHAALAALELARRGVDAGAGFDEAVAKARQRVVFTTHTPLAAGNEAYPGAQVLGAVPDLAPHLGIAEQRMLGLGRTWAENAEEPTGLTTLSLRLSRHANGVAARHGEVARAMWHPLYPGLSLDEVPIGHVTNGVHVPTWLGPLMRALLDRHLGAGWLDRSADPATWEAVERIPDAELWEARCRQRAALVNYVRGRSSGDRLRRGEPLESVRAASDAFDPYRLTVGFARRLAVYKRVHLLSRDRDRISRLLTDPAGMQLVMAGKAHPSDDEAKGAVPGIFELTRHGGPQARIVFLENHDLAMGRALAAGCDVWVNLPRPPLEASGTSGMKAALNGGLNLSVLDGWWSEGYDGANGWAISGEIDEDHGAQDARHAGALLDILEREVLPLFSDIDGDGIPRRWIAMVRHALRTLGPFVSAERMVASYEQEAYAANSAL